MSLLSAGTFVWALFTAPSLASVRLCSPSRVALPTGTTYLLGQLVFGRFFAPLGIVAMRAIVPLDNREASPMTNRGALLALYQALIVTGLFISYSVDLSTSNLTTSARWRGPVGIQMLWRLVLLSSVAILPESPHHMLGVQKKKESRKALATLDTVPMDDLFVRAEIDELTEAIRAENQGARKGWMECFSHRDTPSSWTTNRMMLPIVHWLNGQTFFYYADSFPRSDGSLLSPSLLQHVSQF